MGLITSLVITSGAEKLVRDLIQDRLGLFFADGKSDVLVDKLSPLVIEQGFNSLLDYYYLLKYDESAQAEWQNVMNALSVSETYFWREIDQVRTLVDIVLPRLSAKNEGRPIRIWSAACATGEEPLTIAMAINEAGWFERMPIEIFATDASTTAIQKAQRGSYRERAFRNLSPELRARYFKKDDSAQTWQVVSALSERVTWGVCNLMEEKEVAPLAAAQVIFCRNVFIYFSNQSISRTVRLFSANISPPGYLFVGASESLLRLTSQFELIEMGDAFVYVKQSAAT